MVVSSPRRPRPGPRPPHWAVWILVGLLLLSAAVPLAAAGSDGSDDDGDSGADDGDSGDSDSGDSDGSDADSDDGSDDSDSSGSGSESDADDDDSSGPGSNGDDASDGAGPPDGVPAGDGDDGEDDEDDEDDGPGRGRGPPAGLGHLVRTGPAFRGAFLSFDLASDGIRNVSHEGRALFSAVTVDDLAVEEARTRGASVRIEGHAGDADVEFKLHDTPTAPARFEVDEGAVLALVAAPGVSLSNVSDRSVYLSGSGLQAALWSEKVALALDGDRITAAGDAEVHLLVSGRARGGDGPGPDGGDGDADDGGDDLAAAGAKVLQAASRGAVGAEVHMALNGSGVRSEVVALTDLSVLASQRGRGVVLLVSSDDERGRTVVVHLDPALFDGADDLEVLFDGEPIELASNLDDVLDPTNDGGKAEAVLLVGQDEVQALVSVPSFSVHTIEVQGLGSLTEVVTQIGLTPQQAATALLAAAATVLVAAYAAGPRRRS